MTNISISSRARATTIRVTTDILHKPNRRQQLFPAAALRICDHHLHASGIIPRICYAQEDVATRLYEHDWFCVSQAVQCYTHPILPLADDSSPPSFPPTLLHRVVKGTDPCYCDVWVDSDSIGKSSIHFGGLVSIGHDILAMVRRVFVRMTIQGSDGNLKSAPFSDEEKLRFRENFGFEALCIDENYAASDTKKIKDMVKIVRPEFNSGRLKTRINELESASSQLSTQEDESVIAKVSVGPQHINFGNHTDHAFLAETAFHALVISTKLSCGYVSFQYISEVFLGDVLESHAYRQCETGEGNDSIIIVATRKITGERKVVLIARCE